MGSLLRCFFFEGREDVKILEHFSLQANFPYLAWKIINYSEFIFRPSKLTKGFPGLARKKKHK